MEFAFPTGSRHVSADDSVINQHSYCTSCRRQTEHANPPSLGLLSNGRPVTISYCFFCHKRRFRLVSFNLFHAKTGIR